MNEASMPDMVDLKALFDRWERVWHEGRYDLIPDCVAPEFVRHDEFGDRTVSPAAYATELASAHRDRPNTRIVVYEHSFNGDRAWFRFTLRWVDPNTGETLTRAGMQLYRIESGKLRETWVTLLPVGSTWPDPVAQECWTSE